MSAVLRSVSADTPAVVLDVDMLLDRILEILREHGTSFGNATHGPGMIVWKATHPAIRADIVAALGASIRNTAP